MFLMVVDFIKWLFSAVFTLHRRKMVDKDGIMLVSEKGTDARDNGYHLFLWIKRNHPEITVYYVISKTSPDRPRLDEYNESVVDFRSFKSFILYWKAKYLVSTHQRAGYSPLPYVFLSWMNRHFRIYKNKKVCFLQHGITKDYMPRMLYDKTLYNLFVCGAKPEHEYMVTAYYYPDTVAKYTGFCRYDNIFDFKAKRQILVMPTWRKWLVHNNIKDSEYLKVYISLLSNKRLADILDNYSVELVFYPHHMIQPYVDLFKKNFPTERIVVADQSHYDVQTLLKESALLITDYSSVYFDFAYMKKPVIYYQFDYEKYRAGHFQTGWFDYNYSFGPVRRTEDDLIAQIEYYLKNDMKMEMHYQEYVDYCFPIRDTCNCERVYNAILHC